MSQGSGDAGFIVFDPAVAAVANAIAWETGAGGGLISGNGTYYSKPTAVPWQTDIGESIYLTGNLAGTLTVEWSNSSNDQDLNGTSRWDTYTPVNGYGFAAGVATISAGAIVGGSNPEGISVERYNFGRFRLKLVITSGTGTIESRRRTKGS